MGKIFLWFYCLPIPQALLILALATAVFLLLRERFRDLPNLKPGIAIVLLCWMAVILMGTLGQRTEGGNLSEPIVLPFQSYLAVLRGGTRELLRTNFMNVVLFYPAGLLAGTLLSPRRKSIRYPVLIACGFALLSIGIEFTQYRFGLGLAETDDVIHNALGSLLGLLACRIPVHPLASLLHRISKQ